MISIVVMSFHRIFFIACLAQFLMLHFGACKQPQNRHSFFGLTNFITSNPIPGLDRCHFSHPANIRILLQDKLCYFQQIYLASCLFTILCHRIESLHVKKRLQGFEKNFKRLQKVVKISANSNFIRQKTNLMCY